MTDTNRGQASYPGVVNEHNRRRILKEERRIENTSEPITESLLVEGLRALGVRKGMTLICHISLSSLGWVCGGAQAVTGALMRAVGEGGNLVMPAYTGYNSDPEQWRYPAVPKAWWTKIRAEMPAYDKERSQTHGMGAVVDCFRAQHEVWRSNHPRSSFLAWGKDKKLIVSNEELDFPFGVDGPLGKSYGLDAHILTIGVDYTVINSFYLAYYLAEISHKEVAECRSVINAHGVRKWVSYKDYKRNTSMFKTIYEDYEKSNGNAVIVGNAACKLASQITLVDFVKGALERMEKEVQEQ